MRGMLYIIAVALGLVTGYVDWHSDDIQTTILLLFLFSGSYGYLFPKHAWRWAFCIGIGVPLIHFIGQSFGYHESYPVLPSVWVTLFAFIPSFLFAYLGVIVQRVFPHKIRRI